MFQLCACHSDTPQYNSSETFRNVPLLLSHVCPAALSFDGYESINGRAPRGARGLKCCIYPSSLSPVLVAPLAGRVD